MLLAVAVAVALAITRTELTTEPRGRTMFRRKHDGNDIDARVDGSVQGQLAIGNNIDQRQSVGTQTAAVSPEEWAQLRAMLAEARAQIATQTPPDRRAAALERLDELEQAITAPAPDLTTMEYVRGWFVRQLPALAGTVAGILVNPIVGKLVAAAGEAAARQLEPVA